MTSYQEEVYPLRSLCTQDLPCSWNGIRCQAQCAQEAQVNSTYQSFFRKPHLRREFLMQMYCIPGQEGQIQGVFHEEAVLR